jgi:hypothetical protein
MAGYVTNNVTMSGIHERFGTRRFADKEPQLIHFILAEQTLTICNRNDCPDGNL